MQELIRAPTEVGGDDDPQKDIVDAARALVQMYRTRFGERVIRRSAASTDYQGQPILKELPGRIDIPVFVKLREDEHRETDEVLKQNLRAFNPTKSKSVSGFQLYPAWSERPLQRFRATHGLPPPGWVLLPRHFVAMVSPFSRVVVLTTRPPHWVLLTRQSPGNGFPSPRVVGLTTSPMQWVLFVVVVSPPLRVVVLTTPTYFIFKLTDHISPRPSTLNIVRQPAGRAVSRTRSLNLLRTTRSRRARSAMQ